jgi:sortase A
MAATASADAAARPRRRARTWVRRTGNVLIGLGVVAVVYALVVWFYGDPITALYAHHEQAGLERSFEHQRAAWPVLPGSAAADPVAELTRIRGDAHRYATGLTDGQAFGRLEVPRMGLHVVVVQGTDYWGDLSKGPGHYTSTAVPGAGTTVAIAGHRTTFGAWFRHIDSLRNGDPIVLQMPYATFRYRVQYHQVVPSNDWAIVRPQGYERLVLSACHPLYSASHRWIVFARAVSVTPRGGAAVALPQS